MNDADIENIVAIGRPIARRVFAGRGNHAEIHLSEEELSAIIGLAVGRALDNERIARNTPQVPASKTP